MSYTISSPRFIVLEGGDGSGKTTLRKALFSRLTQLGRTPLSLNGSSWMDLRSTEIITRAKYFREGYEAQAIINAYTTDRILLCEHLIRPMLRERDVISDRYVYSDLVYASRQYGFPSSSLEDAYRAAPLVQPDLVIFLDTPPETAVARLVKRGKSMHHWESLEIQQAVFLAYQRILKSRPLNWSCPIHIVDNTSSQDQVASDVYNVLQLPDQAV